MTFMGKILVVLNMIMGIFFMAFAMIVYTTRVELRSEIDNHLSTISKQTTDLAEQRTMLTTREKEIEDLKAEQQRISADYDQKIADLTARGEQLRKDMDDYRKKHSTDEVVTSVASANQNIRDEEIEQQREFRIELEGQKAVLVKENSELKDRILQTSNDLKLTLDRSEEMAERIAELERYINIVTAQYDVPPIDQLAPDVESQVPPPNIEGVITKVDPDGKHILISLGADDGIKKGHILEMWRTKPEPVYIGRVKVESTDHTTAVVKVVQLSGRALPQPNDRVGPNIMPYRAN